MTDYTLPRPRLTPGSVPPPVMTSDPATFAGRTLRVRLPAILQEAIELNRQTLPCDAVNELDALRAELISGTLRPLHEKTPDRWFWDAACAPHTGYSWAQLPWYFAEAYFYRRILEATGYFQAGPLSGVDPFGAKKQAEWARDAAPAAVERVLGTMPEGCTTRLERLIHASLWGNRTDLSYHVAAHLGRHDGSRDERHNLLADDTPVALSALRRKSQCCALLADNAGTELLLDLALLDALLAEGQVDRAELHLKPQPLFVSDAMPTDVWDGIRALEGGGQLGQALADRINRWISVERLTLVTHWHYASSLPHYQMPRDLHERLARCDLVFVKGDANYRRLLGDAEWPETTPFAAALRYFPAQVLAMRTLKGGVVIGLTVEQARRLDQEDQQWRENGQRGVIQHAPGCEGCSVEVAQNLS